MLLSLTVPLCEFHGLSGLSSVNSRIARSTKRLTSTYFMQRYHQIMRLNGLIHLKTDSPFLYTYTTEMLRLNPYPVVCTTDDLYAESLDSNALFADARALKTHYEKQWLDRGMSIKYIEWRLAPLTKWEEPTIEIEKDSYRSYGRNYNSERKEQHG